MNYNDMIGKYIILTTNMIGENKDSGPQENSVGLVTGASKTPWERTLDVKWCCGSSLSLLIGTDNFELIDSLVGKTLTLIENPILEYESCEIKSGDKGIITSIDTDLAFSDYQINVKFDNEAEMAISGEKDKYAISDTMYAKKYKMD